MKNYGKQRSTAKPPEVELTETMVFVASGIVPVDEPGTEEQSGFVGYEFNLMEYTKDEYIREMSEKNKALSEQMETTQEAIDFLLLGAE